MVTVAQLKVTAEEKDNKIEIARKENIEMSLDHGRKDRRSRRVKVILNCSKSCGHFQGTIC